MRARRSRSKPGRRLLLSALLGIAATFLTVWEVTTIPQGRFWWGVGSNKVMVSVATQPLLYWMAILAAGVAAIVMGVICILLLRRLKQPGSH